jgi:Tfp pilus assembly protein PilF
VGVAADGLADALAGGQLPVLHVGLRSESCGARYHLGVTYKRQGLDTLAMSALTEALKLDPSDTAAAGELQDLQR